jgi:hypothetical protein
MLETARHRETEVSDKKYCETAIGELRKTYGAGSAAATCGRNGAIADASPTPTPRLAVVMSVRRASG